MKWIKQKLINWVLRDLLCAVDVDRVISFEGNDLKINGEKITDQQRQILKEESTYIKRTDLWAIFQNTLADTARKTMFEKSKDFNDMMSGKLLLYALDVQKKIIEKLQ